jgi:DNA-binding protein YbaB
MAGVDPDRWMQDMEAKVADLSAKSAQLRDDLTNSSATVLSKDHAVQVTIAPTGALQNIQLTDHAAGMSPQRLQASIMEAVAKGQRAASEKMIEAFAPIGVGTESMDLVLSYLPPPVEDEEEDYGHDRYDEYAEEEPPAQPASRQPVQPAWPQAEPPAPPAPPARRPRPAHDDDDDEDGQPW